MFGLVKEFEIENLPVVSDPEAPWTCGHNDPIFRGDQQECALCHERRWVFHPSTPRAAGNITDNEIRELKAALFRESGNQMTNDTDACGMAFYDEPTLRHLGRMRCAEIFNARESNKLTADTITDAQIRELGGPGCDRAIRNLCKIALNDAPTYLRVKVVRDARARCADIINKRKSK